ncbi:hypothetical protein PINS_up009341 [Pythium insidiosum]|nr:hypothetical protein PINS_up009341 [Pythium insidiosum]
MQLLLDLDQDAMLAQSGAAVGGLFATKDKPAKPEASADATRRAHRQNTVVRAPPHKHKTAAAAAAATTTTATSATTAIGHSVQDTDDDAACAVCLQRDSLEHDPIVLCELCGVAVHQSCYRLDDIPDDDWYCHPCARYLRARDVENNVTPTYELPCAACAQKGGAFIATVDGKWVHMACSMFLPELYVQSSPNGEIIGGLVRL